MFERFNLKDNSFPVTPNEPDGVRWFGFGTVKQEFERVMERSSNERLRLCVLNRGKLGAGKTHAAHYFATTYADRQNVGEYLRFLSFVMESPKQAQKAFIDFATRFFNAVTFRRLAQASQNLRALTGADPVFSELLKSIGSEDIATVLANMSETNLLLSKAFLLGGGTAKELRELGVAKKIASDHEFATAMVGAMYMLIHGQSSERQSVSRVVLWVDEMEDLVYFPTRYYLPFTQAMRELIDNTNEHFTLMLNFTFSEPEDLPAIENVLGQAIMQRVNQHIVFQQPTTDDFRNYLIELFKANRLREPATSVTYPFSEDAFTLLVEAAVSKTPRFLNKLCDMLLRDLQEMSDEVLRLRQDGIPAALIEERLPQTLNLLEEARG
jgi:hypothetical protein